MIMEASKDTNDPSIDTAPVAELEIKKGNSNLMPCALVVSDWSATLSSCLLHCFDEGKYCDLIIKFSNENYVKVHRVVLESCCSLARVGVTTTTAPHVVHAHPHVTADLLCPLIRFLYTGAITLNTDLLRLARLIKLTLLLDCVRKLGSSYSTSLDSDFDEAITGVYNSLETPSPLLHTQREHSENCDALCTEVEVPSSDAESCETSNAIVEEIDAVASMSGKRSSDSTANFSSKSIPNVTCESQFDCTSREREVMNANNLFSDTSTKVNGMNSYGPTPSLEPKNTQGGQPGSLVDGDITPQTCNPNSNVEHSDRTIDCRSITTSPVNAELESHTREIDSREVNNVRNSERITTEMISSSNTSKGSCSYSSENEADIMHFSNKILNSLPVQSTVSHPSSSVSIFPNMPTSEPTIPAVNSHSDRVSNTGINSQTESIVKNSQSSCEAAFDALLRGKLTSPPSTKPTSAVGSSSVPAFSATVRQGGNSRGASASNILLLPTNSQILEKVNAAARRRGRALHSDVPRPTRFHLDDLDEVSAFDQTSSSISSKPPVAQFFKDFSMKDDEFSSPSASIFPETFNDVTKQTVSNYYTSNDSKNTSALFHRSVISTSGASPIKSLVTTKDSVIANKETQGCPADPGVDNGVDDHCVNKEMTCEEEKPLKKYKRSYQTEEVLELSNVNSSSKTSVREISEITNASNVSVSIASDTIAAPTASTSASSIPATVQVLSALSSPRKELKNSFNCYEIKPRDNQSYEVVPSSVSVKSKFSHTVEASPSELNNHTKIITEVLKKYPNLVKDKKNVKLRILKHSLAKKSPRDATVAHTVVSSGATATSVRLSTRKVNYECSKCSLPFTSLFSLKTHILKTHEEPSDVLEQSENNLHRFLRQPRLSSSHADPKTYQREAHLAVQMKCKKCDFEATKESDFTVHMLTHFTVHKCGLCDFVGCTEDMLRHHASVHKLNSYACSSCSVSFKSLGALQGHVQAKVCQKKKVASFACPNCTETFSKSYNLKAHLKARHKTIKSKINTTQTPTSEINKDVSTNEIVTSSFADLNFDARYMKQNTDAGTRIIPSDIQHAATDGSTLEDDSCASSSFVVGNEVRQGTINSNSSLIEIVGTPTDCVMPVLTNPLAPGTIIELLPISSQHEHTALQSTAWMCVSYGLTPNSFATQAHSPNIPLKDVQVSNVADNSVTNNTSGNGQPMSL
ncbi:uncharacterized protein LOC108673356 [Hyalella azteca]|uniref:Uncharacterized protein LOC108673356 n=1 Tax=Hyalella azteca TaxID=294128 RepID=A0A8B7NSI1_HYAAZ|nr:uncharacterized protein LOC108673356 [Hyalella azteca]